MTSKAIAKSLAEQFDRVWSTLRDALAHLDEEQYHSGEIAFLIPRNLTYHTVETADFYSSDCEPDGFPWGHIKADTKELALAYIEQVQAKVRQWTLQHDDEQWLSPQSICKWTGATVLDRGLYALRHTQHHTAQINAELWRRGLPRGEWH